MAHELPLPPAAIADSRSLEMIRVWMAEQKLHCVLNIGFWESRGVDERRAWGVLLADMLHHIANAHEQQYGRDPKHTIERICEALEAELQHPTSGRPGEFFIKNPRNETE
jgi:hypothetical protein